MAISQDFIKRGFKHCTGPCSPGAMRCWKGVDRQGFYDWCKKECLHDTKKNRDEFVKAIDKCDAERQHRWKDYKKGTCLSVEELETLIWKIFQTVDTHKYGDDFFNRNLPDGLEFVSYQDQYYQVGSWYNLYLRIGRAQKTKTFDEPKLEQKICSYKELNGGLILKLKIK